MVQWFSENLWKMVGGAVAASLIFAGCGGDDDEKSGGDTKPQTLNIRVAETTDMHGAIFPYDFINDTNESSGAGIPSLANVSTYAKVQQAEDVADDGFAFVLLDNGDLLQGQPVVNVYNNKDLTQTTHIYADAMNYMQYDVSIVGNHDVEPGHAVYDNLVQQFNFPWLAANVVKEGTEHEPYFEAYTVIEREGVKIAVLGLTTPGVPMWLPAEVWSGIAYEDMVESAAYWVPKILEEEKPDLLIGLFHAGWDYTYGGYTKEDADNPNAVQLVIEAVPGFDIVFFGHDHEPGTHTLEGVQVAGGGSYCNLVSTADINLTWNETTQSYDKSIQVAQVSMSDYAVDEQFMTQFDAAFEETKTFVQQSVGTFTASVNSRDAMFKDAAFNDLVHEVEWYVANNVLNEDIDMAIAAPLQYDVAIDAGEVKYADMWKLYKYDNTYYVMTLSGAEIKAYLEYNYDLWMNRMESADDHLINFSLDENGSIIRNDGGCAQSVTRYYNYDSISGITYTVDVREAKGDRITITGIDKNLDGEPDAGAVFDMSTTYKVGINSYRAGGGGGHMVAATGLPAEELPDARTVTKTETGLREYLLNWIADQGTVTPRAFNNWKVIPEEWAVSGEAKSYDEVYSDACVGH